MVWHMSHTGLVAACSACVVVWDMSLATYQKGAHMLWLYRYSFSGGRTGEIIIENILLIVDLCLNLLVTPFPMQMVKPLRWRSSPVQTCLFSDWCTFPVFLVPHLTQIMNFCHTEEEALDRKFVQQHWLLKSSENDILIFVLFATLMKVNSCCQVVLKEVCALVACSAFEVFFNSLLKLEFVNNSGTCLSVWWVKACVFTC